MSDFLHGVVWALPVAPLAIIIGACIGWMQHEKQKRIISDDRPTLRRRVRRMVKRLVHREKSVKPVQPK